jgi:hypothetical protein
MFTNVRAKIGGYEAVLPLSAAQVARVELICDTFITVYNFVEQTRATTQQLTDWQDLIFKGIGGITGDSAPKALIFQIFELPVGSFVNIFEEFRELREQIVSADGYHDGIGEDLMIVAPKSDDLNLNELQASAKLTPLAGYKVRAKGSLRGMDAMRFDYQRKGASDWTPVGFVTKLSAEFIITPQTPGEPETGVIRVVLMEKNQEVGQPSPLYPITIS